MVTRCEFIPTDRPRVYRCRRCGFTTRPTRFAPDRIRRACRHWNPGRLEQSASSAPRGLGDAVAWWIDKLTFGRVKERPGCGCRRRREWLNKLVPFRRERLPNENFAANNTTKAGRTMLLRFPHGLGDAVQLTSLLLHLRALRPDWTIDLEVKPGASSLFAGLARNVFVGGRDAFRAADYDVVHTLGWEEPVYCYRDSPSTKAERALREVFSLAPQPAWCRYHVGVSPDAMRRAAAYLREVTRRASAGSGTRFPAVVIHYQGNSARRRKNLDEQAVRRAIDRALAAGYVAVLLDFESPPRSALVREGAAQWPLGSIVCPGIDHALWQGMGTGDGETLAALIAQAALFIGIDSGPAHIAGATETPSMVVWTGHHPVHYFGLADNVLHLVPDDHQAALRGDREAGRRYFAAHYRHRTYRDLATALPRLVDEALRVDPIVSDAELVVDGDRWVRAEHRAADMVIVRDVDWNDAYQLASLRLRPRTIADIGAHIGSFAMRARRRWPAAEMVCVEANPANLAALRANVGEFASVLPLAATYDGGPVTLVSSVYPGSDNTGGFLRCDRRAGRLHRCTPALLCRDDHAGGTPGAVRLAHHRFAETRLRGLRVLAPGAHRVARFCRRDRGGVSRPSAIRALAARSIRRLGSHPLRRSRAGALHAPQSGGGCSPRMTTTRRDSVSIMAYIKSASALSRINATCSRAFRLRFISRATVKAPSTVSAPPTPKRLHNSSKSSAVQSAKRCGSLSTASATAGLVSRSKACRPLPGGTRNVSTGTSNPMARRCKVRACGFPPRPPSRPLSVRSSTPT